MRTEPGEQGSDRLAVSDHDPVDAANLAGLGLDAVPASRTNKRECGFGTGAGHFQRRGSAGLGERSMRQERTAPGRDRVAAGAGHDLWGQTANRTAPAVDESGLPGQRLAFLDDADDVTGARLQSAP